MLYDQIAYPSWLNPNSPLADQEGYVTYSGIQVRLNIQPESPVITSLADGQLFATYHFFTGYSGLQPGWRLTISGSSGFGGTYSVRGVERYNYGAGQHYEGTLERASQ